MKAKIGATLAKVAYDEVLKHQKEGSTITLTMWYTLVNHKENTKWDFRATTPNYKRDKKGNVFRDKKGNLIIKSWDCGLGQVNMSQCTAESLTPEWAIKKSIGILAYKNIYFANKEIWMTFKRYNGGGAKATEYANVCMRFYNQYMKGA